MHILHIMTFLTFGAGNIILNLALKQRDKGHQVALITSKTSEIGNSNYSELMQVLIDEGIELIKIDSTFKRDLYLNFDAIARVKQFLSQFPADLIHAHAAIPAFIGIVARAGQRSYIPIIQTMHGWGLNKNSMQEAMDVTIMNSLDKVVAVSSGDQTLLKEKGVDQKQLMTIYNGINPTIKPLPHDQIFDEIQALKTKGFKIIGCVGTLEPRKNQSLLLQAFKDLKNKEQFVCVFIGGGEWIHQLKEEVRIYKIEHLVKFYGYQKYAYQYMPLFDCLVLPSKSEGLSITVLEAFRAKVPVLVSNIPQQQELVEHCKNGYIFKSEDYLSLLTNLETLLSLSKEEISNLTESAYQKFTHVFALDSMVNQYENLYTHLQETHKFR